MFYTDGMGTNIFFLFRLCIKRVIIPVFTLTLFPVYILVYILVYMYPLINPSGFYVDPFLSLQTNKNLCLIYESLRFLR